MADQWVSLNLRDIEESKTIVSSSENDATEVLLQEPAYV